MAQTGLPAWSQTAASNSNADSTINFAEGQAPSSVNNSARALMAALAKWRDDNSGALTTGGTTTAYTVTTNQTFDSLSAMNGQTLRLKFNAANGASPTLNVDGLGAKAIHSVGGTAIGTGAIVANAVYDLVYDNSNSRWVLVGGNPVEFPSGTVMLFRQTAAPTGWTKDTNYNNFALRVTSGTVGVGGSTGFTSVLTQRTIARANLPNVAMDVTGTITVDAPTVSGGTLGSNGGGGIGVTTGGAGPVYATVGFAAITLSAPAASLSSGVTSSLNGGVSQTAMDFNVAYTDVILASKN